MTSDCIDCGVMSGYPHSEQCRFADPKPAKAACTCKVRQSTSVNGGWIIESSEGCPQHNNKLKAAAQKEAAEPRADGWYWVRCAGPGDVKFDWTIRRSEAGRFKNCHFQPEIIGPRIPAPDEPCPVSVQELRKARD